MGCGGAGGGGRGACGAIYVGMGPDIDGICGANCDENCGGLGVAAPANTGEAAGNGLVVETTWVN
tara:strand:- start:6175 stop:6369 length:195 start_codon:yes stop_codon:yes gene_type:complete